MVGAQPTVHLTGDGLPIQAAMVTDFVRFAPGFVHRMHYHPHADQILVCLGGRFVVRGADQRLVLEDGGVLIAPAGAPHEIRNESGDEATALVMFPGIHSVSAAGYVECPALYLDRPTPDRPHAQQQ